jgi:hypothetical protein
VHDKTQFIFRSRRTARDRVPDAIAMVGVGACSLERIRSRAPFADRLLAVQHEPGGSSTGKLTQIARNELAPAALRVDQVPYGLSKIDGFDRIVPMPHLIEFGYALTPRVIGLQDLDALPPDRHTRASTADRGPIRTKSRSCRAADRALVSLSPPAQYR